MHSEDVGISFIIPAYNEENAIANTIDRLSAVLVQSGLRHEIVVVDDGSRDCTAQRAAESGKARVIRHPTNAGYGRSIKTGIMNTRYPWLGIVDADGTYPVEKLPELLILDQGFDMVVASRANVSEHDRVMKMIFRKMLLQFIQTFVSGRIVDPNSGFRVFTRRLAMRFFPFLCNTFSFTTSITLFAVGEGHFVKYVPINYAPRVGKSKVRHFRDSVRMAHLVLQGIAVCNPQKVFLLIALASALFVALPTLAATWLGYGTLALYYFFFGLCTALLSGLGFLADVIRYSDRKHLTAGQHFQSHCSGLPGCHEYQADEPMGTDDSAGAGARRQTPGDGPDHQG